MAITVSFDQNSFFPPLSQVSRFRGPRASVGQPMNNPAPGDVIKTYYNSRPQAAQVTTVTVASSPTSDYDYTLIIGGNSVFFSSDASATRAEVIAAMLLAIQEDPLVSGLVDATSDSTKVTLTSRNPGFSFTATSADADLTIATTTAANTASAIPFGVAVVKIPDSWSNGSEVCAIASVNDLTAQVVTIGLAGSSGEQYLLGITVEGQSYSFSIAFDTNIATTLAALIAAVNLQMPANTVIAAGTSPNLTLTAEVAGKAFTVSVGTKTGTAANMAVTYTTAGPATDFLQVFAGVSVQANNMEGTYSSTSDAGSTSYPPNAGVQCARTLFNGIAVENSQTPTDASDVYVELSASTDTGKFFTTTGATRLKLPRSFAAWIGDPDLATDGIGALRLGAY